MTDDHPSSGRRPHVIAALAEAHRLRPTGDMSDAHTQRVRPALWLEDCETVPVTDVGPTMPFAETVARRRSIRQLATTTATDIGLVVARAGLTRSTAVDRAGAAIAHRAAPSAGGRQPLTLVVLARDVIGLPFGSWALDADAAVLRRAIHSAESITKALEQIADALRLAEPPPAAVVAVAHPDVTLSRYPEGLSLLWREVGAILMLVHLAAVDIGLGSCFVGTCGVLHPVSVDPLSPIDLGAVAIGSVPSSTATSRYVEDEGWP
jgi:SagB-type dehydrogenase family enzyme